MDNLKQVQKVLFSGSSLEQINFEYLGQNLSWDNQKSFLEQTALHPLLQKYPIKRTYLLNFLKRLIDGIAKHSEEVHDDLYNYFCEIKSRQNNDEKFAYKHFIYNDHGDSVTIMEATSLISDGTTGLCTWEAAIKLAEWAIDHKNILQGKTLLELGSGIGFAGICIVKTCEPNLLYMSDCHEKVLELLNKNVNINGLNDNVRVLSLNWGDPVKAIEKCPDFLIASDIIYDDTLFPALLKTVDDIFEMNADCVFILACTLRNEETLGKFLELLSADRKFKIQLEAPSESNELKSISPNLKSVVNIYRISL